MPEETPQQTDPDSTVETPAPPETPPETPPAASVQESVKWPKLVDTIALTSGETGIVEIRKYQQETGGHYYSKVKLRKNDQGNWEEQWAERLSDDQAKQDANLYGKELT